MDKSFINLNDTESKELCLIRRCLYDFLKNKKLNKTQIQKKYVQIDKLTNIEENHSGWLLKRLIAEGFIKCLNAKKYDF